ncbi:MAG: ATP-binding protein [Patescibacteria group bacterium]
MSLISRFKGAKMKLSKKRLALSLGRVLGEDRTEGTQQTKDCLAASHQLYQDLVEMAHEGITRVDPEDNLTFVNKQFASSLGYKVSELIGRSVFSIATKDSVIRMKKGTEMRRKGVKSRYEVTLIHRDSSLKHFLLSASPMYSPAHEFVGSMGVYADVTEQKAMEMRLSRKVKQIDTFYRVYEHAKMSRSLSVVLNSIIRETVEAFPFRQFVHSKLIFDGKTYCYPNEPKRWFHKIRFPLVIAGVKRGSLQVGYSKKMPRISSLDSFKEERKLIRNVAEILCKHMHARGVLDRYREIIKKSFTAIIILSQDKILYVNPRFYRLFKCKEKEVMGRSIFTFFPFYNSQCVADGKVKECKGRTMEGKDIDLAMITQRSSYHGKPAVLARINNISALKKAQGRLSNFNRELKKTVKEKTLHLEEANKRLQSLNQLKDEFIAITSHELRSPLTSIRGYLSFLVEEDSLSKISEPYRDYLVRAYSTTDALNHLINNILDVSRLDMGRFQLQKQYTDIIKLVRNILDSLSFQISEKRLELEFENQTGREQLIIHIDSIRMSQVLRNILDNSVKFTNRGKKIRVTIKCEADLVSVVVADQGVGIPKAKLEQIFDKFMQVKTTQTKYKGGVGLGLFIAKRIAELHGGRIEASKNSDGGTSISFHLPLQG